MLKSIVNAEVTRGDGTLLDVTFLKDFGPWKFEQSVAQLVMQDDWLVELDIDGEEMQRVQVQLSPVMTNKQLNVTGRHPSEWRGRPDFYSSYNDGVLRIDDHTHPDFWIEAHFR